MQQLCHKWVVAFPHQLKGIFVSSIFLLKLQVTTLSFSKHSLFYKKSGSALPQFYSNVFPPSLPRSEKLTILVKHTHWFFLSFTPPVSHILNHRLLQDVTYNVLFNDIYKDKFGEAKIWEPVTLEDAFQHFSSSKRSMLPLLLLQIVCWKMKCLKDNFCRYYLLKYFFVLRLLLLSTYTEIFHSLPLDSF